MRTGSAPVLGLVGASIVIALAAGTLGTGTLGTSAEAQQPAPETARATAPDTLAGLTDGAVITDGEIYALARDGDRLYVQGGFQQIGRYAGPGDRLGSTGRSEPIPEIADGQVSVVVSDGAGGWYLGGDFTRIGGRAAGGLAHVRADGSLDPSFLPDADGLVSAVALQGSTLYVGGDFRHVGGTSRKRVAAVSTTDGHVLPFDAPQASWVTELVASPAAVYIGTDRVTAVDPGTGTALAGFDAPVRGGVHALTLGGGLLYVGTDTLVALNPTTGARVPSFAPAGGAQKDRSYHSLLRAGPVLYVGSDRTARLQALDSTTGAAVPGFAPVLGGKTGRFGTPRGVYDLALDGDRLWIGGRFTSAGGRAAHGLAILDAASGAREDTGLPAYNRQVNAVELSGGDAFVGGTFFMTDWVRSNGIAALDADTLEPDPGFRTSVPSYEDLLPTRAALYVTPTHGTGYDKEQPPYWTDTARIHAFDPRTGDLLPRLSRRVRNLSAVTTIGNRLYVARRLESDVSFPLNQVDVYGPKGRKVASYPVPLRGYVTALTGIRGDLVVAGSFKRTSGNGGLRNTAMIRIDAGNGHRRPGFDPKIHGPVYDVVAHQGSLYASGIFKQVFQSAHGARPGLVKLSATSGLDAAFRPTGFRGLRSEIRLTPLDDVLYVDGWSARFVDTTTGKRVSSPSGSADLTSVVTAPGGGYTYATSLSPNLGGSTYPPTGILATSVHDDGSEH
jgi:hypothetical protein